MTDKHEALADYVRRICFEKKLSFRKVSERSSGQISHASVAEIANGVRLNPSTDTLSALAKGLGEPPDDIFRVARGLAKEKPTDRFEIYAEAFDAHDLSESEWQYMELFFKDQVERFRNEKIDYRRRIEEQYASGEIAPPAKPNLAPVVAEMHHQVDPKDEVRKMIDTDQINEAERRTTPRKKAG